MALWIKSIMLLVGLINFAPIIGVLSQEQLEKLYGIPIQGQDMLILMRHRAVLLGLVGGLLVMEGDRIVGIITERDYARNVILKGKTSPETPVRDIMTAKVVCVTSDQTIVDCLEMMTEKRIRHLPVVDDDRLVGLVSIGDLVKRIIDEQRATIEELRNTSQS